MTDKKLTDKDVVEGLERCISTTTAEACEGCPFNKQNLCNKDQWALERYALDLIKRQQVENEKLQKNQDDIDNFARDICKERLLKGKAIANFDDLQEYIRKEKSKAVKEFAEALKKRYDNPVWYLGGSNGFFDNLDSFVKEMVGIVCPTCNTLVGSSPYCRYCGQALDWSDRMPDKEITREKTFSEELPFTL